MKNNIDSLKSPCCGCSACSILCPVNAIKYSLTDEGCFIAQVNEKKCIDCGKCKDVCLKNIKKDTQKIENGKLYSAYTKDQEVLSSCTSGGIAYEIGKYAIENGYEVVGVIYDSVRECAKTIIVNNIEDLNKTKGSKYLQSDTAKAYKEVINQCKNNEDKKYVIFGTPCQIYGIKELVKSKNIKNDIIYVDLFCHGVPSYLIWKKYLMYLKENKKIKQINEINFRDKKYGWHNFVIKINSDKGVHHFKSGIDPFYKCFFDNIFLNPACKICSVRKEYTSADIRLGDFWGSKFSNNLSGVSAVLVNTKNGKDILNKIESRIIIQEENIKDCFPSQSMHDYNNDEIYKKHIETLHTNKNIKIFVKDYRKSLPYKYVLNKNIKELIDILPVGIKNLLRKIKK